MRPHALVLVTLLSCDPGYEQRHRQFRLDRDRERREAAEAAAAEERTARPVSALPPAPSASEHAYAELDRELAKIRQGNQARTSTPAEIEKRMRFAERYQREQRCEYAGVVGPTADWLQTSGCTRDPIYDYERPLFEEARKVGFSRFHRYRRTGRRQLCCTFDFATNVETCGGEACSARK